MGGAELGILVMVRMGSYGAHKGEPGYGGEAFVQVVLSHQSARRTLVMMLALALALLVLMSIRMQAAHAQTTGYQVTVAGQQASTGSASTTASTSTSSGTLPFTGSDVSLLAGAGVALVVLGGAVYVTSRRQRASS